MDLKKFLRNNILLFVTVSCILFWCIVVIAIFALRADAAAAPEVMIVESGFPPEEWHSYLTPKDLREEAYYDSLELLAICVEAEAGNQPLDGRRMVVDVILNRVDDPDWPDTIEGVITQPYQFSTYWDGAMDAVVEPSEETFQAVRMELENRGWPGLYYFTSEGYSDYGTPWKQVGNHYFSTK